MQDRYYTQIHEGMDVLDQNGDRIGKCGETIGRFFNVDAGFLGTKEYYVPFSAISEVRDNSIFLNVVKSDLDRMGWDQMPDQREVSTDAAAADTMRLREEQLQARKSTVETGSVHLGKDIVEEQRTMDVPVTREEVYVERHPVDRRPSDRPIDETESETVRVPVREEQVEVEKKPVVYEEVGVGKRVTQDTQQVSETVRREELRTDKDGEIDIRNDRNP